MEKIYKDTVGLTLRVDCGRDLTGATSTALAVMKPDGTTDLWTASIVDSNYLEYSTISGDLDQSGNYRIQASLTLSGWVGFGETFEMSVFGTYQ